MSVGILRPKRRRLRGSKISFRSSTECTLPTSSGGSVGEDRGAKLVECELPFILQTGEKKIVRREGGERR